MNMNKRNSPSSSQHIDTTFERRTALVTAVGIVALIAYLVIRNERFSDPDLVVTLRIILSLAVGVLGATIPGILNVEYSMGGFVIRATGAIALFVIAYFGTPEVKSLNLSLPDSEINVSPIKQVDFRTKLSPDHADQDRQNASLYLTVPLALRNTAQPGKSAFVNKTRVRFALGGRDYQFLWRSFVTMHEERYGLWLGIDGDAAPFSVDAGKSVYREIRHSSESKGLSWGSFLDGVKNAEPSLIISVYVEVDDKVRELSCRVDLSYWSNEIGKFIREINKAPGRVTTNCMYLIRRSVGMQIVRASFWGCFIVCLCHNVALAEQSDRSSVADGVPVLLEKHIGTEALSSPTWKYPNMENNLVTEPTNPNLPVPPITPCGATDSCSPGVGHEGGIGKDFKSLSKPRGELEVAPK